MSPKIRLPISLITNIFSLTARTFVILAGAVCVYYLNKFQSAKRNER